MDKSFEKQNGWRRNNKYEYSYTIKEIVCESNNFSQKQLLIRMISLVNFSKHLRKE